MDRSTVEFVASEMMQELEALRKEGMTNTQRDMIDVIDELFQSVIFNSLNECNEESELPPHGTLKRYRMGCKCQLCRDEMAAWARRRHARNRKIGLPYGDPRHGTLLGYTNYGCRASCCVEAYNLARGIDTDDG